MFKLTELRRHIGTYLFLGCFCLSVSFGQLEKITLYAALSIYIHEIIMAGWLGYWLIRQPNMLKDAIKQLKQISPPIKLLAAWVLVGWALASGNHSGLLSALLYAVRLSFYGSFLYSLFWLNHHKLISAYLVKLGITLSGLYLLYFGFLQYIFLPDTRFLHFFGWDDHYYRLISTFLDPGFTGIIFILTIYLLCQLFATKTVPLRYWPLKLGLILIITLGILLTYSRATYLAYAISAGLAILYLWWRHQRMIAYFLLASVLMMFVGIPFLPRPDGEGVKLERTSTIISRSSNAQTEITGLHGWQWLTGQGLFVSSADQIVSPSQVSHARLSDNWLVMWLSGTGLVGTVLFVLSILQLAWFTKSKNTWFRFAFIAVLIHGFFDASLVYPFVLIWLGGLALAVTDEK